MGETSVLTASLGAAGEECGGAESARSPDPERHLQLKTEDSSEAETDDSDDWQEIREQPSRLTFLRNDDMDQTAATFVSDQVCHIGRTFFSGSGCLNQITVNGTVGHEIDDIGVQREAKQEENASSFIKEEQEEVWISQADTPKCLFNPVPVKSEDDEEKSQFLHLHQRPSEQIEMGANGEDCGGPEPAKNSVLKSRLPAETEVKTENFSGADDSVDSDFWTETRQRQPSLESVENTDHAREMTQKTSQNCSECGKTFKTKWLLKQHMRIHVAEKPFSCSFCTKSFHHKGNLTKHLRVHTGEKPFSCSECGQRYVDKSYLKCHLAVHTGEKRFCCRVCKVRFSWHSQLKKHKCVQGTASEHPKTHNKEEKRQKQRLRERELERTVDQPGTEIQ